MNVYMYNLSDGIFMETIVYLQNFGFDYYEAIRKNLDKLSATVLEVFLNSHRHFLMLTSNFSRSSLTLFIASR
jgi:hypothetical protein